MFYQDICTKIKTQLDEYLRTLFLLSWCFLADKKGIYFLDALSISPIYLLTWPAILIEKAQ